MIYYRTKNYVMKAAVDKSGGIMVALQVPPEIASKLALEGGQPASDLHITLVYLGKDEEFGAAKKQTLHDIVSSIANEYAPIDVTLTGYGVFPETDDGPCLYAAVGLSDSLDSLQETVEEAVASYGMPPQGRAVGQNRYRPHITLAYGESAQPPGVPPVTEFKAEWLRSTFGATEGLFRFQGVRKSFLMKAAFEESQHPRAEDGKFSEGGGGEGARVFMTPDDVIEQKEAWGGKTQHVIRDPKTGKGTGMLISPPIDRKDIPETLYHMTTNLPAVHSSGYLKAATDGGGMGGGNGMPGVSFTTSKADADLMAKEMGRCIEITKATPDTSEKLTSALSTYAREDEKIGGMPEGTLQPAVEFAVYNWSGGINSRGKEWNGESWESSPIKSPEAYTEAVQSAAKEGLTAYHQIRDSASSKFYGEPKDFQTNDKYAPLKNPLLFGSGEDFAKMDPARIGIITTSKKNLPGKALVRAGSDDFLHEIRVHADVPLDKIKKDGDAGSSLIGAQDGQATNLDTMNHDKRRKPIDGQAYTAFTPDGSLGSAVSPGIMKAMADSGKKVAIDFDGTITTDEQGTENPKMRALVDELKAAGLPVVIFTARPVASVRAWLKAHDWPALPVTNEKTHDIGVYLDDRAVHFSPGDEEKLADTLRGFKTWWETKFVGAVSSQYEEKDPNGDPKRPKAEAQSTLPTAVAVTNAVPSVVVLPAPVNVEKADNREMMKVLGDILKETKRKKTIKRTVVWNDKGQIDHSIEEEI